jgi:oligosaccharyltransferase complex subunit alpha (ribophorin I)
MPKRWRTLPFLVWGLLVPSFAFASQPFENTAIVRTVELGASLVHVTSTFAVKALEPGASVYTVALGQEQRRKTSWLEAKVKGQPKTLLLQDLGYDEKR